jgi:hypothetical protein
MLQSLGMRIRQESTKYVATVTVTDPDSKLPVEVEIRKCEISGAMVGIDGSFLESGLAAARNPYNPGVLKIPDDEPLAPNNQKLLVLVVIEGGCFHNIVLSQNLPYAVIVKDWDNIKDQGGAECFLKSYAQDADLVGSFRENALEGVEDYLESLNEKEEPNVG